MRKIAWKKKFSTGNTKIDFEHQIFVNLLINFEMAVDNNADSRFIDRLLLEIGQYATFHFVSEENLMIQEAYPLYEEHRELHENLLEKFTNARVMLKHGKQSYKKFLAFLYDWFATHTCIEDLKIAKYIEKKENNIQETDIDITNEIYPIYKVDFNFILNDILSDFHAAIFILNSDFKVVWINNETERFFGLQKADIILKDKRKLIKNKLKCILKKPELYEQKVLSTYENNSIVEDFVIHILPDRNCKELVLSYWSRPIENGMYKGGRIEYYYDITDRKKAEQALIESETKLRESNNTKDKFFSIIAHDLKNPFNSLIGFSEILLKNHSKYDEKKRTKIITAIHNSSKSTHKLLENLLTWSSSQSGKIKYLPEKINLKSLIYEMVGVQQMMANKKDMQISENILENEVVFADRNLIDTILRNLISNAIKFTKAGGAINISSAKKANSNFIEISITDTGVGMSQSQIDDLFRIDKNTSTEGTEEETGTGLGLILCKEFIEKHGGKIRVESEVDKGSSFIFTIPVK